MTTTATDTALRQGYCRSCAQPTFMFDVNATHRPDQWYCNNCYGTKNRYADEHGNTGPDNALVDLYEWQGWMSREHSIDREDATSYLPPLGTNDYVPVGGEDPHPHPHTCSCGSTRFQYIEDVTGQRVWEAVDLDELDPDDPIYVTGGDYDTDVCEGGYGGQFACVECGRDYTGDWEA